MCIDCFPVIYFFFSFFGMESKHLMKESLASFGSSMYL